MHSRCKCIISPHLKAPAIQSETQIEKYSLPQELSLEHSVPLPEEVSFFLPLPSFASFSSHSWITLRIPSLLIIMENLNQDLESLISQTEALTQDDSTIQLETLPMEIPNQNNHAQQEKLQQINTSTPRWSWPPSLKLGPLPNPSPSKNSNATRIMVTMLKPTTLPAAFELARLQEEKVRRRIRGFKKFQSPKFSHCTRDFYLKKLSSALLIR